MVRLGEINDFVLPSKYFEYYLFHNVNGIRIYYSRII